MTEIDIAGDQENTERGGTADTDLQLESEQRAMQALYDIKMRLERPAKLPGKGCHSPHCRPIVTFLGNGRWQDLLSPASKSIASSVRSSGGG